jgi:hypothetical protein
MKAGYLSQHFKSVVAKRLSAVESDPKRSNQHEFNGNNELKSIFGLDDRKNIPTLFLWFGNNNEKKSSDGYVSWYDARRDHPTRTEYRLYFPTTEVSKLFQEGDVLFVAMRSDDTVMIIVTEAGSTAENQLYWLFALKSPSETKFEFSPIENKADSKVSFFARLILDELGIDAEASDDDLDELLVPFKGKFPPTAEFSKFARESLRDINALDDPDDALVQWLDREERLFLRLEKQIISERLKAGFIEEHGSVNVDGFMTFSLGVHNRRKSRAGFSLEHHLSEIFNIHKLIYGRGHRTEKKIKPDFLFPGGKQYHDPGFPVELLTMLGAKTSCKDRWRQIQSEAAKISNKHLLTVEPGISVSQTNEMKAASVQLVLPKPLHESYVDEQRGWLMGVKQFIELVSDRQRKMKV